MSKTVTSMPAASSEEALQHFQNKLRFEADCWDTHASMKSGKQEFVLIDVRAPSLYIESHVPGAINIPHGKMIARNMAKWPMDTLFVVYCAGPHCNGADKAAVRLAGIGRPVKIMIGGITGWADEGFAFATGEVAGLVQD